MGSELADNIARVRERIDQACRRAGRRADSVRLVAVSKTVPPERIRGAYQAGLREFAENRVQEAQAKRAALADLPVTWHLVGHLQSNKARAARGLFHWIHSIDSMRLAQKLDAALPEEADGRETARRAGLAEEASASRGENRLPVLIEVNLGGEAAKSGVEESAALELARQVGRLATLDLRGLMVVPPYSEEPAAARPYFSRLRDLAGVIDSAGLPGVRMDELSMGMSHDFEIAIEEGATQVRVGAAIFGPRT